MKAAESYILPRNVSYAVKTNVAPRPPLGLSAVDLHNEVWDFDKPGCRERAKEIARKTKPMVLVGSPISAMFSQLMALLKGKADSEAYRQQFKRAVDHLSFAMELYDLQVQGGRFFLHERPLGASSWEQPCMTAFLTRHPETFTAVTNMCQFGKTTEATGELVLEPTQWITNAPRLAEELRKHRCQGGHSHGQPRAGPAGQAADYPPALCQTIVRGISMQLTDDVDALRRYDKESRDQGMAIDMKDMGAHMTFLEEEAEDLGTLDVLDLLNLRGRQEEQEEEGEEAYDDVKGGTLPPGLVKAARLTEIRYLWDRAVYRHVARSEMLAMGGRAVRLKWIDTNKGDAQHPAVRSRLVCMEMRRRGIEAIFSATPPLEALRAVVSLGAREDPRGRHDPVKIYTADVSRAHFYADSVRDVFIELQAEDPRSGGQDLVGKLQKTMYGTLDAAEQWALHYAARLKAAGFIQGRASPCCFHHSRMPVALLVHGDDFVAAGRREGIQHLSRTLREHYELKEKTLGPGKEEELEIRILGRILTWTTEGLILEADPGHRELIVEQLGLSGAKSVSTPGEPEESGIPAAELLERRRGAAREGVRQDLQEPEDQLLEEGKAKEYASTAARGNYLSVDRPDLMFAGKELMRKLSKPTEEDQRRLKRFGR